MKVCLVCSHGGHFVEMKHIEDAIEELSKDLKKKIAEHCS